MRQEKQTRAVLPWWFFPIPAVGLKSSSNFAALEAYRHRGFTPNYSDLLNCLLNKWRDDSELGVSSPLALKRWWLPSSCLWYRSGDTQMSTQMDLRWLKFLFHLARLDNAFWNALARLSGAKTTLITGISKVRGPKLAAHSWLWVKLLREFQVLQMISLLWILKDLRRQTPMSLLPWFVRSGGSARTFCRRRHSDTYSICLQKHIIVTSTHDSTV